MKHDAYDFHVGLLKIVQRTLMRVPKCLFWQMQQNLPHKNYSGKIWEIAVPNKTTKWIIQAVSNFRNTPLLLCVFILLLLFLLFNSQNYGSDGKINCSPFKPSVLHKAFNVCFFILASYRPTYFFLYSFHCFALSSLVLLFDGLFWHFYSGCLKKKSDTYLYYI